MYLPVLSKLITLIYKSWDKIVPVPNANGLRSQHSKSDCSMQPTRTLIILNIDENWYPFNLLNELRSNLYFRRRCKALVRKKRTCEVN